MLCHIFSVYLPTVEINVEVIEENRPDDDIDEEEVHCNKLTKVTF